ncbi:MAG: hypothetical protein P1S60_18875 [Anaerolineae bacterium]|nr:hypothetical protein [Anaerolineae bacterium]
MTHTDDVNDKRRRWLVYATTIITLVIFGSRYLPYLLYLVHQIAPPFDPVLALFYWLLYPIDLLFTYLWLYIALSVAGLALTISALKWSRPSKLWKVGLFIGLLAIVALPLVMRYKPTVWVEPGYTVRVPTQPGLLGGVVKATQAGIEVRRCEYEFLGWSKSEGALYGEEMCGEHERTWVFWPLSDSKLETVSSVPDDLLQEKVIGVESVHSTIPFDDTLDIVVKKPILQSPEGWWSAMVARHLYGPEDVVIVSMHPNP